MGENYDQVMTAQMADSGQTVRPETFEEKRARRRKAQPESDKLREKYRPMLASMSRKLRALEGERVELEMARARLTQEWFNALGKLGL